MMKLVYDFPGIDNRFRKHAHELVAEAFKTCDLIYGTREAIAWGSDFVWPTEVFTRDNTLAKLSGFNLEEMVTSHHQSREASRLSLHRIQEWVPPSDPDYDRLRDLADGMRVFLSPAFVCNNRPPPKRKLYLQVAKAVNKILLESWRDGLVFIVTRDTAHKFDSLHYSPVHWTTKVGKKSGRNLFDSSDDQWGPCLNSEEAKTALENFYGTIEHPTIQEISDMIIRFLSTVDVSQHHHVILWKADLKGAFTLLNFRPKDVKYLACELTDDLILLYHTGLFGWTGTPYAFQVITRVIKRLLRKHVSEYVNMYVDDMIGVCMDWEFESIKKKVIRICEGLLGPNAVASDKWDHGRRIDVLGWHIDLDSLLVSIARRNFLKVVCGFFNPNITNKATVHELERLASWSARYTTILRHAAPLTSVLYSEIKGMRNRNISKKVSNTGVSAILIWRYLLCMLEFNYSKYSRSLYSFSESVSTYKLSFDASLEGIGVGVYRISDNQLLQIASYMFPFTLKSEARYQNSSEFIAVVVGMWMLSRLGIRDCNVTLEGDSITALKWGTTERFKGLLNLGAVIAFIMLGTRLNIWVSDSIHIPGEDNTLFDSLSRGTTCQQLGIEEHLIVELSNDTEFTKLISLCNPSIEYNNEFALLELWKSIWKLDV